MDGDDAGISGTERIDEVLVGGTPTLTLAGLARAAGVGEQLARGFWRALGFPDVAAESVVFTAHDVRALEVVRELLASGHADERTVSSLLRALGHTNDRLALWQTEALAEDAVRRHALDDTSARMVVLDRIPDVAGSLQELLCYCWRRQLAALVHRTHDEVALRHRDEEDLEGLPLARAIGFADLVAFTERSARLGPQELATLVQAFEDTARDVVTAAGARVVKMIGDEVLFVADTLQTAARVSLDLVDAIAALPEGLQVRSSLVWGRVLSRSGDVFGPTVNLAARLAEVAEPGWVLMDRASASELRSAGPADVELVPQLPTEVNGLGLVMPVQLRRRHEADDAG